MSDNPNVILRNPDGSLVSPLTDSQLRALPVRVRALSTTAIRSVVPGVAVDVLLLAENVNRLGALIYNDANSILHIGLGNAPVSDSDYSYVVAADAVWEIPSGYVGEVRGRWLNEGGFGRITELT